LAIILVGSGIVGAIFLLRSLLILESAFPWDLAGFVTITVLFVASDIQLEVAQDEHLARLSRTAPEQPTEVI
jgi:hypothetical protein